MAISLDEIKRKLERKDYNFSGCEFPDEQDINLFLGECKFENRPDFTGSKFFGNIFFIKDFPKGVSFANTEFHRNVEFNNLTFSRDVSFDNAKFEDNADFTNSIFEGRATFNGAQFSKSVTFRGDNLFSKDADFKNTIFGGFKALFNTNMKNVSFDGATLNNIFFNDSKWNEEEWGKGKKWLKRLEYKRSTCRDESYANDKESYRKAENVCRNIKQCYQGTGDYEKAGQFYYGEMELKRKNDKRNIILFLLKYTCGYGEKFSRALIVSLSIILIWTFIFSLTGISINGVKEKLIFQYDSSEIINTFKHLYHCFCLSAFTFTTMNYEYVPSCQIFAVVESFFGCFMLALFIFTFSRKMSR